MTPRPSLVNVDDICKRKFLSADPNLQFHRFEDSVGGVVFLPPAHFQWVTQSEKHVLRFFDSVRCGPSSTVVDVGMNDGTYSVLAASRGCRVLSFELQRNCIALACMTLRLNDLDGRVTIIQKPASDEDGRSYKLDTIGECNLASGTFGVHRVPPNAASGEALQSVTLTTALQGVERIEFLKIDVEGHEPQVFVGAANLFRKKIVKKPAIECNHWSAEKFPEIVPSFARLFDWGYTISCLDQPKNFTKETWLALASGSSCNCVDLGVSLSL